MRDSISRIFLHADCNLPSRARVPRRINFPGDMSRRETHAIVVSLSLGAWPRRAREPICDSATRFRRDVYDRLIIGPTLVTTKVVLRVWRNRTAISDHACCASGYHIRVLTRGRADLSCRAVWSFSAERDLPNAACRFRVISHRSK